MSTRNPYALDDQERTRCEVWTRVMGYHRPVTAFNEGKKSEHRERRYFVEDRQTPGGLGLAPVAPASVHPAQPGWLA
jgi:hypothetical protein